MVVASDKTDEKRYQAYRYASDQPIAIDLLTKRKSDTETLEYRYPCEDPKGRDESDLCAQWRAAQAGENSAFWTKWSFWVGSIGVFGLLVTIVQSRIALERAREANQVARDQFDATFKPSLRISVSTPLVKQHTWDDIEAGRCKHIDVFGGVEVENLSDNLALITGYRIYSEPGSRLKGDEPFMVECFRELAKNQPVKLPAYERTDGVREIGTIDIIPIEATRDPTWKLATYSLVGQILYQDTRGIEWEAAFKFEARTLWARPPFKRAGGPTHNYDRKVEKGRKN